MGSSPSAEIRRWRVLVIDDEPAIGRLIKNLLAKHEVVVVDSGEAGLARLREDAAYDVVVCDLMMPELTGRDVYDRIAVERPGLERRIVFITGGAYTASSATFLERIPNCTVEKPFTISALEAAMSATVAAVTGVVQGSR
jgi:two-component system, cell cycle sensor histidine kinase and response regulator CckA